MNCMATVWQYMFHPTIGPINALLALAGLPGPNWLGSSGTVLYSLSIIGVWQSVGFNMFISERSVKITAIKTRLLALSDARPDAICDRSEAEDMIELECI